MSGVALSGVALSGVFVRCVSVCGISVTVSSGATVRIGGIRVYNIS